MVGLRVVANGVAIRNKGAKAHHTVCVGRHLIKQNKWKKKKRESREMLLWGV